MGRGVCLCRVGAVALVAACASVAARGAEIEIFKRPADPYGTPRPAPGEEHVALGTSFWIELATVRPKATDRKAPIPPAAADAVLPESIAVELEPEGGAKIAVVQPGQQFAPGFTGRFMPGREANGARTQAVYVEADEPLRPATKYTVRVTAKTRDGGELPAAAGSWQFTTEAAPATHPFTFDLDLSRPAVHWEGGFFTGFCIPAFSYSYTNRLPTYELMAEVRQTSPRAWSLQRDFWMTGMDHQPPRLGNGLPNVVRELQTRRIARIEEQSEGSLLHVEDFFGHAQYEIPSNRPLSADYHAGDEVLIADGVSDCRATVVTAHDQDRTVLVTGLAEPADGWKLEYPRPLPERENPDAPGLFPAGGCYLRKFRPCGTPMYYWGRLDKEWDLAVNECGRRISVNFADAPGDLSIDGRNWTTAKDYAELHEATRTIAGHVIDRYGDKSLTFVWSVFNEPDLGALFWRTDWNELQTFYDYTVDAVLRAFEDRGYDSNRVFIGGLELGAVFGANIKVEEFLAHCSPRLQDVKGALELNAAFADKRLDGKRSKRVEDLCRANDGRGSPCDFVSIHAYNRSQVMADKLARAKEAALALDPEFYADLRINSHESTPNWQQPPDPAYGDSFLGNGYDSTWCADVAGRQLRRAAADPRYAGGETILTFWPWPNNNFRGGNDCVRALSVDDDGNGTGDRTVTIAMPILHFLGLLAEMGPEFHVLPEQTVGGHLVSGFASPDGPLVRVLLFSHNMADTQSRSAANFDISLRLSGLSGARAKIDEYRFDKDHNSYYHRARELRDRRHSRVEPNEEQARQLQDALADLKSDQKTEQLAGLEKLASLGRAAESALLAVFQLAQQSDDQQVKEKAMALGRNLMGPDVYSPADVNQIEDLSRLQKTDSRTADIAAGGNLTVAARVAGNGACFLVIESAQP